MTLAVLCGGAILVLSLGLSAAGLLPRIDANRGTQLAGGSYELVEANASSRAWPPLRVLNALLDTTDQSGTRRYYLGGVTLGFALLGLVVARRRYAVPFFAIASIVIPLLVMRDNPIHLLFDYLPRYQVLNDHAPFRWFALYYLMPAMLAGAVAETIVPWLSRQWAIAMGLFPAVIVALATRLTEERFAPVGDTAFKGTMAVSVLIMSGIVFTYGRRRWRFRWADTMIKALPALFLVLLLWEPTGRQLTEGGLTSIPSPPERRSAITANLSDSDPGGAGSFLSQELSVLGEPFRYFGYDAAGLRTQAYPQGLTYPERRLDPTVQSLLVGARATMLQLYDTQGYNPLVSRLYMEYLTALNSGVVPEYHDPNVLTSGFDSPLINLLNVRYIIIPLEVPPGRPDLLRLSQLHPTVYINDRIRVLENQDALPHAWITHDVQETAHAEMLAILDAEQIDERVTTLVEMGEVPDLPMEGSGNGDTVTVTHYGLEAMTLHTHSNGNGMLVVSEVLMPSWNVYIDGEEVDVQGVNYLFRGVPLPAGDHTVELRYEPLALTAGLIITSATVAGIALCAVLLLAGWRRTRRGSSGMNQPFELIRRRTGGGSGIKPPIDG
jgi:hypothetical protein